MKTPCLAILIACGLVITSTSVAVAQGPLGEKGTGFVLEVFYQSDAKPTFQPVPPVDSEFDGPMYLRFRRTDKSPAPTGSIRIQAIKIISRLENGGASVIVSALLGVRFVDKEELVTKYLAREGEKITVAELRRFGVEPFEITLLRVTPTVARLPTVSNRTSALDLVSIKASNSTLPGYILALHNTSAKGVTAIAFHTIASGRRGLEGRPQGEQGRPLIEAGAFYETIPIGANEAMLTPGGYQPNALFDSQVVIDTAVFVDGTFEGDAAIAMKIRSMDEGRKMELRRVVNVLQRAIQSDDSDVSTAIANFKSQISNLTEQVDVPVVDRFLSGFPTLGSGVRAAAKSSMEAGSHLIKNEVLYNIALFETSKRQSEFYRAWLSAMNEKYQNWLYRLP